LKGENESNLTPDRGREIVCSIRARRWRAGKIKATRPTRPCHRQQAAIRKLLDRRNFTKEKRGHLLKGEKGQERGELYPWKNQAKKNSKKAYMRAGRLFKQKGKPQKREREARINRGGEGKVIIASRRPRGSRRGGQARELTGEEWGHPAQAPD